MIVSLLGIGWITEAAPGLKPEAERDLPKGKTVSEVFLKTNSDPPYPRFGRMDAFSRTAFAAVVSALKDAGLSDRKKPNPTGIIASTSFGCVKTDLTFFQGVLSGKAIGAHPHHFAYTLPSTFLGDVSIHLGLTGPAFVIQERDPLSFTGLTSAMELLLYEKAPFMVAGAADAGIPKPFDSGKNPRPYALFMVLGSPGSPAPGYGTIEIPGAHRIRFRGVPVHHLFDILRLSRKDVSP